MFFSQACHLRTHLKMHSGEKSNKCNQCDYAEKQFEETQIMGTNQLNVTNATIPLLRQAIWGHIWKSTDKCNQKYDYAFSLAGSLRTYLKTHSGEKSQTNATSVTMPLLVQVFWGHICKRTVGKRKTNATNATMTQAGGFRKLLKTHSEHKSSKCNQFIGCICLTCEFATMLALIQLDWGHIWKRTLEESQTSVINVTMLPLTQAI